MIYFLTSSPMVGSPARLTEANDFSSRLREAAAGRRRGLFISADPDNSVLNDIFSGDMYAAMTAAGITFSSYRILDSRSLDKAAELVRKANLIVLAGGHVPTQNRYFGQLHLRRLLKNFHGVLIGISAGSMNSADTVYAMPEEDGEASDPQYERWLPGLGITNAMIIPHLNKIGNGTLDGQRLMEDIACGDSMGNEFFAIPDGSYLLGWNGLEVLCGAAHRIADGNIEQIAAEGDITPL